MTMGHAKAFEDEFIIHGSNQPALQECTLVELLQTQQRQQPQKIAVVSRWQKRTLTYQSLLQSSMSVAQALVSHGVRRSDRVIVLAGNSIEYLQLFFAAGTIGAVFTIINPTFTEDEVISAIDFISPQAIFIANRIGYRDNSKLLDRLTDRSDYTSLVVRLGDSENPCNGVYSWEGFLDVEVDAKQSDLPSNEQWWEQQDPYTPLCIQFTSGTTGPRKAAMLTHHNLINNAYLAGHRLGMNSSDIVCCSPPLFHCFGLTCGPLAAIAHSATCVIPSDVFNADASLQASAEERCTVINAVPAMFQAMLDHAKSQGLRLALRLRTGIIAGSSLSETLLRRLSDEFGLHGLAYAFGMTELSCISFMTDPSEVSLLDDHISVGHPLPHTSGKVVDSDMRAVSPGVRGELLVSGYLVFKQYLKNPQKTDEAVVRDKQGKTWLRTGDIVTLSGSGSCTVVGRVKDLIKKGGENIAPADVEKVLEQHPGIAAAAVVGIQDPRWGETIGAFVQRVQEYEQELDAQKVKMWLRKRIAAHKIPDHIFWLGEGAGIPEALPINASGKIIKTELSDIAKQLLEGKVSR